MIRDGGPIFSRAMDCSGAVAVFGPAHHRTVLSDIDLFGMPVSAAEHLSLPSSLVNLNRGLHSMQGEQHAEHQHVLMRVLGERSFEDQHAAVSAGLETFAQGWQSGQKIGLLGEMRQLALQASTRLLCGDQYMESSQLALLLQTYFHCRREATSPVSSTTETLREDLITLGTVLDDALRQYIRWCRQKAPASLDGILTGLANLELSPGKQLSEDQMVAHSNVLFISSTEPVAVSLTWILLILSQLPHLRRALRLELDGGTPTDAVPHPSELARLTLLDSVVNESLRLFPANALMVRVTTRPTSLDGVRLPERCELVLCPFLAHRDAERFTRPTEFLPSRWSGTKPSAFEYFPFGAGGHACVGRHLAMYLIKAALALLIPRYELVLAGDQEIDWRIHIQLMPRNDPIMTVRAPGVSTSRAGKLLGPVADLISLDACGL
ncbi:MAG TPA: cytochrome P450 [Blastocatellia bacterium]|nr:cytochrome P450 [Blastocatellia bacterium]